MWQEQWKDEIQGRAAWLHRCLWQTCKDELGVYRKRQEGKGCEPLLEEFSKIAEQDRHVTSEIPHVVWLYSKP